MSYGNKQIQVCRTTGAETLQTAPDLLSIELEACPDCTFTSNCPSSCVELRNW